MYLTFTYNAAGQRTSMVDQTGFTVNYTYDSVGRLSELTDGSGNLIVTYTYDADGRLSLKTNGNGTYTTYQYDADGNVLHLINYAPGGAINSRFDYTYNALGLETTEATLDGTWTYTYDADGQLIHAVFASTNSSVPSQDLAYSYDAMGNRITTVINGVTTAYTTNDMNEYTSVGGVAYTYDADGNLTFRRDQHLHLQLAEPVDQRDRAERHDDLHLQRPWPARRLDDQRADDAVPDRSVGSAMSSASTPVAAADRGLHLRAGLDQPGDGRRKLLLRFRCAGLHRRAEQFVRHHTSTATVTCHLVEPVIDQAVANPFQFVGQLAS